MGTLMGVAWHALSTLVSSVLRGNLRAHLIEGTRNFDIVIYQRLTIFLS